ncbi:thiaminase (transcriptional activator TenA) [Alteribacillus persepolensis]|uniref:Aminopyrimidine aminohydrolase n=1 Tax=Alteribacillus persepolensis TaxID=568899 RepID=A0A1G8AZF6_9BACI|nr:thiaminase II [Alteribacillus persepolensis]SDH26275.1 thiaminase (transcriptional activator TenA) [Alteribacillus persepolensis]
MKFSQKIRQQADRMFEECYHHPFVQGIGQGKLEKEQLIHYVKQDYEYLNAMIQARALGMAKCKTREDMEMFHTSIGFILNSETHPHHNMCKQAGVRYEDLQGYPLAPVAQHYAKHMLHTAYEGTIGDIIAATLPCPWIYLYVGERLMKEINPDPDHPFYDWISFYGNQEEPRMNVYLDTLDRLAETASEEEKQRWQEHFLEGCQLEYMFFDMAYHASDWPFDREPAALSGRGKQ